ncbi:MAG: hypothetical protein ACLTYN_09560 [Dysosmobacter welbionis]
MNLLCALVLGAHAWVAASPSVTVPLQPAAGAAPGRRPGAVSRGRMAGGSLRRGAHRLLGGGTTALALGGLVLWLIGRTGGSLCCCRLHSACWRRLFGNCTAERRIFVKILAFSSWPWYPITATKGGPLPCTPECVDVPLREAA